MNPYKRPLNVRLNLSSYFLLFRSPKLRSICSYSNWSPATSASSSDPRKFGTILEYQDGPELASKDEFAFRLVSSWCLRVVRSSLTRSDARSACSTSLSLGTPWSRDDEEEMQEGRYAHELLTAPKPERRPRMIVPTTIRRAKEDVIRSMLESSRSAWGKGMRDRANKLMETGIKEMMIRKKGIFRVDFCELVVISMLMINGPRTSIVNIKAKSENFQWRRRVLWNH